MSSELPFNAVDLENYIKEILTPEKLNIIKHTGCLEVDFDPQAEAEISDISIYSIDDRVKTIRDTIKSVLNSNVDIDINFIGFENIKSKLDDTFELGQLVKIRGFVVAKSFIRKDIEEGKFRCRNCHQDTDRHQDIPFKVVPPLTCDYKVTTKNHKTKDCGCPRFDLLCNESKSRDYIKLVVQETPEDASGDVPNTKDVYVYKKSLLKRTKVGSYVEIIGVIKAKEASITNNKTLITYIEANNLIVKQRDITVNELTQKEIDEVMELSKQPNVYDKLVFNVSPSLDSKANLMKEAALLAIVGGNKVNVEDINLRDTINVLFLGDPSTGKSQVLLAASKLASKGFYVVGKNASSSGLTASVVKDEDTGGYIVKAGIMALADKGVAAVDEFDKMNAVDRTAMHEAMEQQTITVSKVVRVKLASRTTVLAAANFIMSKYDTNKSVSENIKHFETSLLSRFDLIFFIIDKYSSERDRELAGHIFNRVKKITDNLSFRLLRNYIIIAKSYNPVMTKDAEEILTNFYIKIRELQSPDDVFQIDSRKLESLIRIAESHAKILFKDKVDIDDANVAVRLMSESLSQVVPKFRESNLVKDLTSIDLTKKVVTKQTKGDQDDLMMDILYKNYNKDTGLEETQWIDLAKSESIGINDAKNIIQRLHNKGKLIKVTFAPVSYKPSGG